MVVNEAEGRPLLLTCARCGTKMLYRVQNPSLMDYAVRGYLQCCGCERGPIKGRFLREKEAGQWVSAESVLPT